MKDYELKTTPNHYGQYNSEDKVGEVKEIQNIPSKILFNKSERLSIGNVEDEEGDDIIPSVKVVDHKGDKKNPYSVDDLM